MKILVLSDSHGNVGNMKKAVDKEKPDLMIHLGDCVKDMVDLHRLYPDIPFENVPGNCDMSMDVAERVLLLEGKRIYILHGHTRGVKLSLLTLQLAAHEKEADLVLFGHTHLIHYSHHNGIMYMNPGSIGYPGINNPPSYGVVTIENGSIHQDVFCID